MSPLVSIVIPVYNCQTYIERCISSLLVQEYKNIEILVIDDGSTDSSAYILKNIQDEENRIKYFYQENKGPGAARNRAIRESRGKYLLFVDADDYVSADYILALVERAESCKAEVTIGGYTLVYADTHKEYKVIPQKYRRNINEEWAYRISSTWGRLYLKEFWISNGLLFHEDMDARAEDVPVVLFSNAMAKNITIVENAGYFYFQHPESAMNNRNKKIKFKFPYQGFEDMYQKIRMREIENSIDFFYFGVLKFLAFFDFIIYRNVDKKERRKFYSYIYLMIQKDFVEIYNAWKKLCKKIEIPFYHKVAIHLFVMKFCVFQKCVKFRGDIW